MAMTMEGSAKIRRVGNGLCLPLPTKQVREEGLHEGDQVDFIVMKRRRLNPRAFGSVPDLVPHGKTLEQVIDEALAPDG
ncbi:MAG TPA: hypothetical protein VI818_01850 [Candidatus Thermoplasmatota archaeon]|nr:hypothetical protein [Candidatus Thermoplasmatota archaeon]